MPTADETTRSYGSVECMHCLGDCLWNV